MVGMTCEFDAYIYMSELQLFGTIGAKKMKIGLRDF
jgi:hypothetical protein